MRVLVTGGNGYIGARVACKLALSGYEVLVTWRRSRDRLSTLGVDLNEEKLDISDELAVNRLVVAFKPEAIVHTAALVTSQNTVSELPRLVDANIAVTSHLVAAACSVGCRRLVFTSSVSVYGMGNAPLGGFSEEEVNPDTLYGWSKLAGEEILQRTAELTPGFSPISLRLAGVHGGDRTSGALYRFASAAFDNVQIDVSEPKSLFRWAFIEDVLQGVEKALHFPMHDRHRVFNIASKDSFTLLQVAEKIIAITGSDSSISMFDDALARNAIMNVDRALHELGYSSATLETSLKNYFESRSRTA